jgi:hypothetical protein
LSTLLLLMLQLIYLVHIICHWNYSFSYKLIKFKMGLLWLIEKNFMTAILYFNNSAVFDTRLLLHQ